MLLQRPSQWLAAAMYIMVSRAAVVGRHPALSVQARSTVPGNPDSSAPETSTVSISVPSASITNATISINTASVSSSAASVASSLLKSASIEAYAKPTEQVKQILAIGDSYTAGIGSNGRPDEIDTSLSCRRYKEAWPIQLAALDGWSSFNTGLKPELNFGACSSARMAEILKYQLEPGDQWSDGKYHTFGTPQIAVLTMSGNDADFSELIDSCIYKATLSAKDCQTTINQVQNKLAAGDFETELIDALSKIAIKGRFAHGANPSNGFQVYVSEYIRLFNDDDHGCDTISWGFYLQKVYLTKELRAQLNGLVDQLNSVIKAAADGLSSLGVIYVDGIDQNYNTHRICEPASKEYLEKQMGSNTWFWTYDSPYPKGGEGPAGQSTEGAMPLDQLILQELIPDHVNDVNNGAKPWNFSSAFDSWDTLINALPNVTASTNQTNTTTIPIPPWLARVFHPKGTAYGFHANAYLAAIKANRGSTAAPSLPAPAAPAPPPDECGAWYQFFRDAFEIRGKDSAWDDVKLNRATGQGLLDNLRGCGTVSNWGFANTTTDPNYDWVATGLLPTGTKTCIGDAVLGAGGKTADGCTGPG